MVLANLSIAFSMRDCILDVNVWFGFDISSYYNFTTTLVVFGSISLDPKRKMKTHSKNQNVELKESTKFK
jgi:hypothetical protein